MTTRVVDVVRGVGTHLARPAVADVPHGALYPCSDHNLIYRSDGTTWATWATLTPNALTDLNAHLADTADSHDASAVSFTPAGGLAATDVQAALVELDTEKSGTGHTHPSGGIQATLLDAKGDLVVASAADTAARLAAGADGQVLTADAAAALGVKWAAASGGGGGGASETVTAIKTANYTAAANEIVLADSSAGGFVVTIPALTTGQKVRVKKVSVDANDVQVAPTSPAKLHGETVSAKLRSPRAAVNLVSDGTDLHLLSSMPVLGAVGGTHVDMSSTGAPTVTSPTGGTVNAAILFNKNTASSDYVNVGSGTQEYLLDFGATPARFGAMRWIVYYSDTRVFRNCAVYGSNDNVAWTTLRAPANYGPGSVDGMVIPITATFRYFKLHCEGNISFNSNEWVEVMFYTVDTVV